MRKNLITIPHAKLMRKLGILTAEQLDAIDEVIRLDL